MDVNAGSTNRAPQDNPVPSTSGTSTNNTVASASSGSNNTSLLITAEACLGLPKAAPRKLTAKARRRKKSVIATKTLEKMESNGAVADDSPTQMKKGTSGDIANSKQVVKKVRRHLFLIENKSKPRQRRPMVKPKQKKTDVAVNSSSSEEEGQWTLGHSDMEDFEV